METDPKAHQLDTSGLLCPLPVLKLQKALKGISSGEIIEMRATDPASVIDVPHFCLEAGHKLLSSHEDDNSFTYKIEKK